MSVASSSRAGGAMHSQPGAAKHGYIDRGVGNVLLAPIYGRDSDPSSLPAFRGAPGALRTLGVDVVYLYVKFLTCSYDFPIFLI